MVQPGVSARGSKKRTTGLPLRVGKGDVLAVLILEGEVFYFVAGFHVMLLLALFFAVSIGTER